MTINVEPTAKVIDDMAEKLEYYARDLRIISKKMRKTNDLTYASEALNSITNCFNNLRLDLLATRPIRELSRIVNGEIE